MDFEAPKGGDVSRELGGSTYVARRAVNPASKTLTLRACTRSPRRHPQRARTASSASASQPALLPQPWDYRRAAQGEKQGSKLITERVTLSPSQTGRCQQARDSEHHSNHRWRTEPGIAGKVLPGGADYQNLFFESRDHRCAIFVGRPRTAGSSSVPKRRSVGVARADVRSSNRQPVRVAERRAVSQLEPWHVAGRRCTDPLRRARGNAWLHASAAALRVVSATHPLGLGGTRRSSIFLQQSPEPAIGTEPLAERDRQSDHSGRRRFSSNSSKGDSAMAASKSPSAR